MKKIEGFTIAESTSMKVMGKSIDSSKEAVEIKKGADPRLGLRRGRHRQGVQEGRRTP